MSAKSNPIKQNFSYFKDAIIHRFVLSFLRHAKRIPNYLLHVTPSGGCQYSYNIMMPRMEKKINFGLFIWNYITTRIIGSISMKFGLKF
jgi:hypothetical protein